MAKLTLKVDDSVVARAKRLAERRGTSVSQLVELYLDFLTRPPRPTAETPVLARLRGVIAGADPAEHRRHLERKYR
jgi:Family of unknown function (DUF6364)